MHCTVVNVLNCTCMYGNALHCNIQCNLHCNLQCNLQCKTLDCATKCYHMYSFTALYLAVFHCTTVQCNVLHRKVLLYVSILYNNLLFCTALQ